MSMPSGNRRMDRSGIFEMSLSAADTWLEWHTAVMPRRRTHQPSKRSLDSTVTAGARCIVHLQHEWRAGRREPRQESEPGDSAVELDDVGPKSADQSGHLPHQDDAIPRPQPRHLESRADGA